MNETRITPRDTRTRTTRDRYVLRNNVIKQQVPDCIALTLQVIFQLYLLLSGYLF